MDRGWAKFWRKTLDSGILRNHKLWAFWSYCLLKASHQACTVPVGFQEVPIESGQFVFGRKKAGYDLGMSEQEIRTCLDSLRRSQNIVIKSTNKFSIITIMNWNIYQQTSDDFQPPNQPITNQQITNKQPTNNHKQELKNKEQRKNLTTLSGSNGEIPFREIIEYLNEKSGKNFQWTAQETQKHIAARWKAGFKLDDFRRVIENKAAKWKGDVKYDDYLRPQTLFGGKFEAYLNERPAQNGNKANPAPDPEWY